MNIEWDIVDSHRRKLILMFLFALAQPGVATAQTREPSRVPVLRIETGMHTSTSTQIGVDAANRYLVTASDDKTVRVWDLSPI